MCPVSLDSIGTTAIKLTCPEARTPLKAPFSTPSISSHLPYCAITLRCATHSSARRKSPGNVRAVTSMSAGVLNRRCGPVPVRSHWRSRAKVTQKCAASAPDHRGGGRRGRGGGGGGTTRSYLYDVTCPTRLLTILKSTRSTFPRTAMRQITLKYEKLQSCTRVLRYSGLLVWHLSVCFKRKWWSFNKA